MDLHYLVQNGEFDNILRLCYNSRETKNIASKLFDIAILDEDIMMYYCSIYLAENICEDRLKACLYNVASMILTNAFTYIENSYRLGYYHLLKACKLDINNIDYKISLLLTFSDIPDFKMPDEMKKKVAKEILLMDPDNDVARNIIRNLYK